MLTFSDKICLHVSRPMRWDSDHVVRCDDETREIAKEIVASGRINDVAIALDYFDASINRTAAWVIGVRDFQKALLSALLTPHAAFKALQDSENYTKLLAMQEEMRTMPMGAVWYEFCERMGVEPTEKWFDEIERYENEVLRKR